MRRASREPDCADLSLDVQSPSFRRAAAEADDSQIHTHWTRAIPSPSGLRRRLEHRGQVREECTPVQAARPSTRGACESTLSGAAIIQNWVRVRATNSCGSWKEDCAYRFQFRRRRHAVRCSALRPCRRLRTVSSSNGAPTINMPPLRGSAVHRRGVSTNMSALRAFQPHARHESLLSSQA